MVKERISLSIDKEILRKIDREVVGSRSEFVEGVLSDYITHKKSAVILAGGPSKKSMQKHQKFTGHFNWVTCAAWHPEDLTLITGSTDNSIMMWNFEDS